MHLDRRAAVDDHRVVVDGGDEKQDRLHVRLDGRAAVDDRRVVVDRGAEKLDRLHVPFDGCVAVDDCRAENKERLQVHLDRRAVVDDHHVLVARGTKPHPFRRRLDGVSAVVHHRVLLYSHARPDRCAPRRPCRPW